MIWGIVGTIGLCVMYFVIGYAVGTMVSAGRKSDEQSKREFRRLGAERENRIAPQGSGGNSGGAAIIREQMELRPEGVPVHIAPEVATTDVPKNVPEKKPRARRAKKTGEVKT